MRERGGDEMENEELREELVKMIEDVLPPEYNEYGISKDEFNYVNGWNSYKRATIAKLHIKLGVKQQTDEWGGGK